MNQLKTKDIFEELPRFLVVTTNLKKLVSN